MSTIGSGNGHSPTRPRWVRRSVLRACRQMSAEVPPISTVTMSPMPHAAATSRAPTDAGRGTRQRGQCRRTADRRCPRRRRRSTASAAAARATPASVSRCRRRARSAATAGITPAFSTAASLRSYSRTTGSTSHEAVTATLGQPARRIAATRRSCAGWAKECSRHTATACTSSRRTASAASARWPRRADRRPRRRGRRARSPRGRVRADRAARLHPGEQVGGRGMSWRPISMTWRKPAVVTRAVRAPLPSRIRLVATVVPCSTRPMAEGMAPAASRASAHAGHEALRRIGRCAGDFRAPGLAGRGVGEGDVGEGAADIDGDGKRGGVAAGTPPPLEGGGWGEGLRAALSVRRGPSPLPPPSRGRGSPGRVVPRFTRSHRHTRAGGTPPPPAAPSAMPRSRPRPARHRATTTP